jgi:DNA-binding CsgD family transcriptional regulator
VSTPPKTDLSRREREILALIATGHTSPAIADQLHLSPHTVKTHVRRLFDALGARDRAHAVHLAWQAGILPDAIPRRTQVVELPAGDVGGVER